MIRKSNIDGAQNVEVSKKLECEKPLIEQLEIMENYTRTHRDSLSVSKHRRELNCLKTIFPKLFAKTKENDLIAGRLDFLPIGFGSVTSLGGVGHYCVFNKLRKFKEKLKTIEEKSRVDKLYDYWMDHDLKAIYCNKVLKEPYIGRFIDCNYPMMATARLSGMMLHYDWLCDLGIKGIKEKIQKQLVKDSDNEFLIIANETLDLFQEVVDFLISDLIEQTKKAKPKRLTELKLMIESLKAIRNEKPTTFHQAIQLIWIYALLAGCINYGRLDDILGPYMVNDINKGLITKEDAFNYLKSLWTLIENRRTTVNGRIIVGGKGRKNPKDADEFAKIAIKVTQECKYVEPQFTLRFTKDTPQEIWDMAMDSLGDKATYPTLYNDDVNVPAVEYAMRVDNETAKQYVPFGCGEFVIQGQSVGTPNTLLNMLMLLNFTMNKGVDPNDGIFKCGPVKFKDLDEYTSFDEFYLKYKEVLEFYSDLSIDAQYRSYEIMNEEVSFLFTSILMDDCIEKGKALLDGGVRYLGGTNETYGNINASDSLYVIKKLVFDDKKVKFSTLNDALLNNFEGYEDLRKECLSCAKYGNDIDEVDDLANDLYEMIAKAIRNRGIKKGMQYYLIVISNNQTNTEWGRKTSASADGRLKGTFMNPANNPVGGASVKGPTAVLNSLSKFKAKYHGGSVQNIKFTPSMFNENREAINSLFKTYFDKGGCQLMVTVVDHGVLEDAQKNPDKYPDLIVRVSGFSAIFVNLEKDVQDEVMSRVLYG